MNTRSAVWELIGALSGAATVVLLVASMAMLGAPDLDPGMPSAQLAREIADIRNKIEVSGIIALLGMLAFILFVGYISRNLRRAEGDGGWLTSVAYGGGMLGVAVYLGLLAINFGMTSIKDYGADTQVAKTLVALQWSYIGLFAPPLIAFAAAASAVIIRFRALPIWLGWLGVPVAISLLVPWIGMMVFFVWIAVLSVVLAIQVVRHRHESDGKA